MAARIEAVFAGLQHSKYKITSSFDRRYNCIAYAAGDTSRWWWPDAYSYWPAGVERKAELSAFVEAFRTLGYERCKNAIYERGYEKVAIYVDAAGLPTHMARQLSSGEWVSKLGQLEDIHHETLQSIGGPEPAYGSPLQFMRRRTNERIGLLSRVRNGLKRLLAY